MEPAVRELLFLARRPRDLDTVVLAGVIGTALEAGRKPLIRGLSEARFEKLLNEFFIGVALANGPAGESGDDEFADLLELLLESRSEPSEPSAWLAYAVASAAMGPNHLWQDMGLPNRRQLSDFLRLRFAPLAARNTEDMRWKEFLFRQIGERTGVPRGKSPHCDDRGDCAVCFGSEDD